MHEMMKSILAPGRLIVIAVCIILLIIFIETRRPPESEASREFQRVVNLYEQQSKASFEEGKSANPVAISVRSLSQKVPLHLQVNNITPDFNREKTDEVVHLLNLIHDAGIISKSGPPKGDFLVHVEIDNQVFEGSFRNADANSKTPLRVFLKLMQLDSAVG